MGFLLTYDSRDIPANAYKGIYLEANGYKYIIGAKIKTESKKIKERILNQPKDDRRMVEYGKGDGRRLLVGYTDDRARKDAYNREKGVRRLEKAYRRGTLTKENINKRGYNKFLTMEGDVKVSIDYDNHPLTLVRDEIVEIFRRLGFTVAEGPEIEDDWHVFSSLNFAEDHPARDMQDTFFIQRNPDVLLRTHTSSVQSRVMEHTQPPIRIVCPGRVYRNEAISARAHCFFHQVEALYVDKNVSFADLKQTLLYFAREMFGADTEIRLRPSYFPFTEPSAEMDISCKICGGKGCAFCKHTGWVEILGCGMVDPNVLDACGIDSKVYNGFALGMGVERIANLKYRVSDLRLFSENDVRFLEEFAHAR